MNNRNFLWHCKYCNKFYSIINKRQHLLKRKHILNVLNYQITQQVGKGFLDEPVDNTNLPEPLKPTKYLAPKQLRVKRPRIIPKTSITRKKMPQEVKDKVRKLIEEITPYYQPEKISTFKKLLKFIPKVEITEKGKALKGNVKSFQISIVNDKDPALQLSKTKADIANLLKKLLEEKKGYKFQILIQVMLSKQQEDGKIYRDPYFKSQTYTITNSSQINEALDKANENIWELIAKWISEGSNWVIEEVKIHYVNINAYVPLSGSSYIPLPAELRGRKGLINIKNEDNKCFLWCHNRAMNPMKKNAERITLKDRETVKQLDYSGITFPIAVKDIDKIEEQNAININLFNHTDKQTYPLRLMNITYF